MTATAVRPTSLAAPKLSFGGVLRSEWIKLVTLRSTLWSLGLIVLLSLAIGLLMAATFTLGSDAEGNAIRPDEDSARTLALLVCTVGLNFGQLIAAVLGVLVVSGEYSTGMIKSSLAAVPRRLPVLWAKAIVLFVSTTVVGLVTVLTVFLATAPLREPKGLDASLLDPEFALALGGGALYLGLVAVFALGLGTLIRSSAGGIAAALGAILVLPVVFELFAMIAEWARDLMPYLISNAGSLMFSIPQDVPDGAEVTSLSPGVATLVVLSWAAVALALGAVALRRRDA
ncbi:ABC transporter permease subunit [Lysobacter korlensis]|uniref:ABC transporter permease subunit n=1 Tax=Lysobacter korlensis TaxID=553636 RepID=A0ABV6RYT0_9GAMM